MKIMMLEWRTWLSQLKENQFVVVAEELWRFESYLGKNASRAFGKTSSRSIAKSVLQTQIDYRLKQWLNDEGNCSCCWAYLPERDSNIEGNRESECWENVILDASDDRLSLRCDLIRAKEVVQQSDDEVSSLEDLIRSQNGIRRSSAVIFDVIRMFSGVHRQRWLNGLNFTHSKWKDSCRRQAKTCLKGKLLT